MHLKMVSVSLSVCVCVFAARIPKAYCQDRFCSAHEFCGEQNNGGKPRCHCRAIFASKYRSTSTFGESAVKEVTTAISLE